MTHIIRLRGPWQYQALARTVLLEDGTTTTEPGELPPPGRVQMPSDWGDSLGADFRGRVRYTRYFHRPTGLDGDQRVTIGIRRVDAFARVSLNGRLLGEVRGDVHDARFDVTDQLQDRNQLTIDVELPRQTESSGPIPRPAGRTNKPGGLVGEVRLEIG